MNSDRPIRSQLRPTKFEKRCHMIENNLGPFSKIPHSINFKCSSFTVILVLLSKVYIVTNLVLIIISISQAVASHGCEVTGGGYGSQVPSIFRRIPAVVITISDVKGFAQLSRSAKSGTICNA